MNGKKKEGPDHEKTVGQVAPVAGDRHSGVVHHVMADGKIA